MRVISFAIIGVDCEDLNRDYRIGYNHLVICSSNGREPPVRFIAFAFT